MRRCEPTDPVLRLARSPHARGTVEELPRTLVDLLYVRSQSRRSQSGVAHYVMRGTDRLTGAVHLVPVRIGLAFL